MSGTRRRLSVISSATLLGLVLIWQALVAMPAAQAEATDTVTIDTSDVVQEDFLGIGVNLIPTVLMENNRSKGYTDAHWERDQSRILTVEPSVARVWFQIDWMEPEKGQYTWESEKMLAFYTYLDALQAAGTEVELNFGWKVGRDVHHWFSIDGITPRLSAPADLEAYAVSASELLNELINERGYDNVRYLSFYNEPAGNYDFEAPGDQRAYYAEMATKVHEQLIDDGRRDLVEIWGPEEWNASSWTQYMHDNADDTFDMYSFHVYGGTYISLTDEITKRTSVVGDKPVGLTEFGFSGRYDSRWEAGYGNYVIKMANEGVRTGLAWQLNGVWLEDPDEHVDTNSTYTLWDSVLVDDAPNPRYYEAGLLTRYVPQHSAVLATDTSSPSVRATTFATGDGDYTVVVETQESVDPRSLSVDFGVNIGRDVHKFVFTEPVTPEENALLPSVSATFPAGSSFTDSGIGTGRNVIVYTTLEPETQVAVSPANASVTAGQNITLDADVIDGSGGVTWSVVGDGNGSVTSGGVYTAPPVAEPTTVAVRATAAGDPTSYGVALLTVLPASSASRVEMPEFDLTRGSYRGPQQINITSATDGATIHYTTDGSTPTAQSAVYDGTLTLSATSVLRAIAVKDGLEESAVASALYRIMADPPGPDGYEYCANQNQICGFDGAASVAYGANGTYAYAIFDSRVKCDVSVFGYDPTPGVTKQCFYQPVTGELAASPTFSPAPGEYHAPQTVEITAEPGATIHYTANGSLPTTSSPTYTGPISVPTTRTLKAIAVKDGVGNSPVALGTYDIVDPFGGPDGFVFCSNQWSQCTFPGTAEVAYGAWGNFVYGTFENSLTCSAAAFGNQDPAPGHIKKCYYKLLEPASACPAPDPRATVVIRGEDSGTANRELEDGCTLNDLIDDEGEWSSKAELVRYVEEVTSGLVADGLIDARERATIVRAAARSDM